VNLLIDSHVLLWWFSDEARLSKPASLALHDPKNRIYVSAAVAWELAIKVNSGKLAADGLLSDFAHVLAEEGFRRLAISTDHALRAGKLPPHHLDPFDRMLAAQASVLNFPIITADKIFDSYGVQRVW
jgi:PIN domain nuclease of toxin-antitoxin system